MPRCPPTSSSARERVPALPASLPDAGRLLPRPDRAGAAGGRARERAAHRRVPAGARRPAVGARRPPAGTSLVHTPPAIQFANLALRNAWFAGGIEFNIGTRGHSPTTCSPLHAALLPGPDGTEVLRMWEYERLRGGRDDHRRLAAARLAVPVRAGDRAEPRRGRRADVLVDERGRAPAAGDPRRGPRRLRVPDRLRRRGHAGRSEGRRRRRLHLARAEPRRPGLLLRPPAGRAAVDRGGR